MKPFIKILLVVTAVGMVIYAVKRNIEKRSDWRVN